MIFKLLAGTAVALLLSTLALAQQFSIPPSPTTKEEFKKSEPQFIAAAKWLETNAINNDDYNRIEVNAWVVKWIIDSPVVSIAIQGYINEVCEKNAQLLAVFLSGYARYCLENNYSKDLLKANTAGLKAALNCYALGGAVKKNKTISKAIEADKEGTLEAWVKEKLK